VWQPGKHGGAELTNEPGSLTWTELSTSDIAACKTFYPAVLGVSTRDVSMGQGMTTYTVLEVLGRPVAGAMPLDPAAFTLSPADRAGLKAPVVSSWSVYFAVDDCDSTHAKALELGAASVMPPQDSPAGRFAILTDPQ